MSTPDLTPTVVLVHGAFVDASSWNGVIGELKAAGLDVVAPPNLLRGVGTDAAYLTGFVAALGRPVVLAGHSYAGAVISQTGSDASNVAGLVYVAAYAPEAGETLGAINARYPDVPLAAALRTFTYTDDRGEQATDTYVDAALFHDAVCAEAPADVADTLARTQRPASLAAFATAVTGTPAWKTLPSWAVVATADHAIHPNAERDMAKRAGSEITEIDASHAVPATHPGRGGRGHRPRGQGRRMSAPAAQPFGPVQRIAAGVLEVGYVDVGPPGGRAVLLLHGWPYDIYSYADAAPALAAAGYRVIVPYLRGYGVTRFRSDDAVRNGQQSVLAVDAIALLDALGVDQAIVAGFDWGARTANVMAALWPERCRAMVSVSGYLIGSQAGRPGAVAAGSRTGVVVPVLLRHRARAGRLRGLPPRLRPAHLAVRVAGVALRRCDVRAQRGRVRQSRPRCHRHPQLPVADRARGRRTGARRARAAARGLPGDLRADDHARGRRERRAAPRARRLRRAVHRQVRAPDPHRRHRPQPAARGAARLRPRRSKRPTASPDPRGKSRNDNRNNHHYHGRDRRGEDQPVAGAVRRRAGGGQEGAGERARPTDVAGVPEAAAAGAERRPGRAAGWARSRS